MSIVFLSRVGYSTLQILTILIHINTHTIVNNKQTQMNNRHTQKHMYVVPSCTHKTYTYNHNIDTPLLKGSLKSKILVSIYLARLQRGLTFLSFSPLTVRKESMEQIYILYELQRF